MSSMSIYDLVLLIEPKAKPEWREFFEREEHIDFEKLDLKKRFKKNGKNIKSKWF